MAVKFVQVDESQKGEPGVEEAVTTTVVGGQTLTTKTYGRLERHDDLDPSVTEDVFLTEILIPVMGTEEYETGEMNEDGTATLASRQCLTYERRELDLGAESLKKLHEALQPFADVSRPAQPVPAQTRKRRAKAPKESVAEHA
ncbi:hypothetical protein [Streptomyces sp. NPDC002537]